MSGEGEKILKWMAGKRCRGVGKKDLEVDGWLGV